ncbi:unnamed protein product [Discosporangium mesarthrocarpum]
MVSAGEADSMIGRNARAWSTSPTKLLVAGFLARKIVKDLLGRWSAAPLLLVGLCVWIRWRWKQHELERQTRHLHALNRIAQNKIRAIQKATVGRSPHLVRSTLPNAHRQPGDRIGSMPTSSSGGAPLACSVPTSTKTWSWLGGLGERRSEGSTWGSVWGGGGSGSGSVGGGGYEWRGAFRKGMEGVQKRKAFRTAKGKVYLRNRPLPRRQDNQPIGGLEPVREEDERAAT